MRKMNYDALTGYSERHLVLLWDCWESMFDEEAPIATLLGVWPASCSWSDRMCIREQAIAEKWEGK